MKTSLLFLFSGIISLNLSINDFAGPGNGNEPGAHIANQNTYLSGEWTAPTAPSGIEDLYDVFFINETTGWAVGLQGFSSPGVILKTLDGGNSWTVQSTDAPFALMAVHFINETHGWAAGEDATIMHTSDGGDNWGFQDAGATDIAHFEDVYFADENTGWVVGRGGPGSSGVILKTTDGGTTWTAQSTGISYNAQLLAASFVDENTGWVVGTPGLILHTSDGGNNWTEQPSGSDETFEGVHFVNASTGWVVGYDETILHTADGGNSWTQQTAENSNYFLRDVFFVDENTGWVIGNFSTIHHTIDGGNTWTDQSHSGFKNLYALHFTDAGNGWAVGSDGIVLRYNNGTSSLIETSAAHINAISRMAPNPATDQTVISFELDNSQHISLVVVGIDGKTHATLLDEIRPKGKNQAVFHTDDLAPGLYFVRLTSQHNTDVKPLLIAR